jgi:hypothetical protein
VSVQTTMLSGERTLWSGEPGSGIYFQPLDLFLVPFSLMWCGFAIFWSISASASGAPRFFDLWGLMFVAFGLYFVLGRFIVDMWIRGSTHYAVTNRRILIDRGGIFGRQIAINLADLPPLTLRGGGSGRGTIRFGESYSAWNGSRGFGAWSPSLDPTPQFIKVDNAKDVFDLINRARDDLLRDSRSGF